MSQENFGRRGVRVATLVLTTLLALGGMAGVAAGATPAGSDKVADKAAHASTNSTSSVQDICNYTTARPTLRRGSSGAAVKQAQCYVFFSVRAADLAIDGQFGPNTEHWVRVFQSCAGITVDGVVGPQTWSFLTFWANSPNFVC